MLMFNNPAGLCCLIMRQKSKDILSIHHSFKFRLLLNYTQRETFILAKEDEHFNGVFFSDQKTEVGTMCTVGRGLEKTFPSPPPSTSLLLQLLLS